MICGQRERINMVKAFRFMFYGGAFSMLAEELNEYLKVLQEDGWYIMSVDKYPEGRDVVYVIIARNENHEDTR